MAKFPVINVGDIWTADLANSIIPDVTYKTAATIRASNATLTADPDLVTPTLVANGTYLVEFFIYYATSTAAGFQTSWTQPAGVTTNGKTVQGLNAGATDQTNASISMRQGVHGNTSTMSYGAGVGGVVTASVHMREAAIVGLGATAGTITLNWAQVAITAVNTQVGSLSYVRTTRLS
jgi:hypothetical protein